MGTLESFYNCLDREAIGIQAEMLEQKEIKSYILKKIIQKAVNYPELINFNFKDLKDLSIFEKNLIGETRRQFLNIVRAAKIYNPIAKTKMEKILEKAVIAYIDLKGIYTASLNQKINQDGKTTELIDLIPATSWETYEESKDRQPAFFETEEESRTRIKAKNKKRGEKGDYHDPLLF